jgi:hypothetical protein
VAVRRRKRGLHAGRWTLALAGFAATTFVAVVGIEIARVWRRGSADLPQDTDDILAAAEEAVTETATVVREGYRDASNRENAFFNMLTSFVLTFLSARTIAHLLRSRRSVGPFRNFVLGPRHIHHFVPGIALAFLAGAGGILTRDENLEPKLAVPFGVGMGLTLDESALLLQLEDVYWSEEGILSVQITLAVTAMLGSIALGLRLLRRGEQVVLEADPGPASEPV